MTSLLLSLFLISGYEVKWPDPYVGFGFNTSNEKFYYNKNTAQDYKTKKFITFGFPFKIKDPAVKDPYAPVWVIVPDFGWSPDINQFTLSGGIEAGIPLLYRSRLSSLVWGVQTGVYYNLLTGDGYLNESGTVMNSNESTSIAFLINAYVGPRYEFSDHIAARLMINPKFFTGKIALHTYRSEFSKWAGLTLNINVQLEFL
ncbi:MAG: hypothetical protein JWQ35_2462 [Bacteriovoracaceae bacterium]|nr:hypothetical protein [Bacteriovoracaceae bacterium]